MIEVVVGSNVSQGKAGIEDFKNTLQTVPAAMKPLQGGLQILNTQFERLQRIASLPNLSFRQIERLQGLMASTQGQIKRFEAAAAGMGPAFQRIGGAATQANFALLNTGRVIQDLPFGFLGIANNLNPLLESFQRLKAESGSSRIALQQLGKSFLGAGGLGFALSLASSAMILLTSGFQSFSRKAKEAKEDVDRLKELIKELGKIPERRESIAAGTTDETSLVQALSRAVIDQTKSYNERNNALNQLKEINKNYFGDLTLESASLAKLTGKVTEYTNALIAAATVKAFADDIAKINVELSKQFTTFNKAGDDLDKAKRKLSTTKEFTTSLSGLEQVTAEYVKANKEVNKTTSAYDKQSKALTELRGKQKEFKDALTGAVNESLKFKPLQEVKPPDTKEFDKFVNETIRKARQFADEFGEAFVVPDLSDSFFKTKKQIFQLSKQLLADVSAGKLKIRVPVDIGFDFVPAEVGPPLARVGKDLEEAMRAISGIKLEPFKFDKSLFGSMFNEAEFKKFEEQGKKMFSKLGPAFTDVFAEQFAKAVQDGMKKGLSEIKAIEGATLEIGIGVLGFSTMLESFDKLVDAIADGKNAFASFGQFVTSTIKGVITQLLKAAAAAAILSLITGGTSKVGGLNFIGALGKIFGGGRFAKGGIVPAGYPNDSYPALLSSHEVVLNPHQISSLLNNRSSSQPIVMGVELSGDIIRLVQQRSEKRAGRSYG